MTRIVSGTMTASRASARFSLSYSPDQPMLIARRQLHFFVDLFDRLFDRGSQIPASHVEGHCHIAAVAFAVDVVRAVLDLDFASTAPETPALPMGESRRTFSMASLVLR